MSALVGKDLDRDDPSMMMRGVEHQEAPELVMRGAVEFEGGPGRRMS